MATKTAHATGTMVRQGNLRGDKVRYPDETWYCVWYPMGDGADEEIGHCFDLHAWDIDDMIALLQKLKEMEASEDGWIKPS